MTKYIFSTLLITCLGQMAFGQANYPIDSASGSLTQVPSATTGQTAPKPDNYNAASSHDLDSRPLSKGGFFTEPMIIATREDTSIKTSQLSLVLGDTSGKSNGYGVGLRLGGHINEVFLLGVDARYAKTTLDDSFYRDRKSVV